MSEHVPAIARATGPQHYSTHNWSDRYQCPTCGKARRFNTNFLGSRAPVCDGTKIISVKRREPIGWRQARERDSLEAAGR